MSIHEPDVEKIFDQARLKGSPGERAAFVDGACGDNVELRKRVAKLLEADGDAGSFLSVEAASETAGTVIDRYKLLQKIGEGGFGVVYMAEQREPVKRKVALKIIKRGMDTEQVIARFEAERQALALMDHPNIAKVLDAGATESGLPYFVMELVKGVPITEYCDTQNASTQQRLRLFVAVCQAIQHAHQKGIIHRDIKPSNVLVTLHDGVAVPKVIDFGIAKATNVELTQKTLFTEFKQFVGTPEYMSPEQAEMSGLDIDSRSDVYALGVLLYELLTGTTPLTPGQLRSAGLMEMQRLIREEEPPKPSTRFSSLSLAEPKSTQSLAADVARHRKSDPRALTRQLRGDLDWIVMKALEKDRTRRYETSTEFARDIERHLQHEAVEAGPPSRVYRLRKFVMRNRVGVLAGSLVLVALVTGLALASFGLVRAQDEAAGKRAVADFYEWMFTSLVPYRTGSAPSRRPPPGPVGYADLTVADMLRRAEASIESALSSRPELEASVRRTIGWTMAGLGSGKEATRQLRLAFEVQQDTLGPHHPETRHTLSQIAFAAYLDGSPKKAAEIALPNFRDHEILGGRNAPFVLDSQRFLASMLMICGELDEAGRLADDLVERAERAFGEDHGQTLWARYTRAAITLNRGHLEEANRALRDLKPRAERSVPNSPVVGLVDFYRAMALVELGRFEEAKPCINNAVDKTVRRFGEHHPLINNLRGVAALVEAGLGDPEGAEKMLRAIEETQRRQMGSDNNRTTYTIAKLAGLLIAKERFAEAEALTQPLANAVRTALGERGTEYLQARHLHARAILEQGRFDEAARLLEAIVRDAETNLPGGFLDMPAIRVAYGRSLAGLGRFAEAETQLLQGYEGDVKMRGAAHRQVKACAAQLVALYEAWDKPEQAREWRGK